MDVIKISVGLIIFATLGVAALLLLLSQSSAINTLDPTVAIIAVTVVCILAALAVALGFFEGHGL
jgi:ABC-type nitrate/sulfonate/bicarbonate transport system substrate-binding protein